jgi:hypothetical protein
MPSDNDQLGPGINPPEPWRPDPAPPPPDPYYEDPYFPDPYAKI